MEAFCKAVCRKSRATDKIRKKQIAPKAFAIIQSTLKKRMKKSQPLKIIFHLLENSSKPEKHAPHVPHLLPGREHVDGWNSLKLIYRVSPKNQSLWTTFGHFGPKSGIPTQSSKLCYQLFWAHPVCSKLIFWPDSIIGAFVEDDSFIAGRRRWSGQTWSGLTIISYILLWT